MSPTVSPSRLAWLYAIVLLSLNVAVAWPLFFVEWTHNLQSIEGAFISIARVMRDHWGDWHWWPFWYGGLPFVNTYQPGLHLSVAAWSKLTGWPIGHAYHFITGLTYALGPVAVFLLARRLTGWVHASFLAALCYSLLSPSAWLLPGIRIDMGHALYARRLEAMVFYGEGPHVTSLLLVPIAMLLLDRFYEHVTGLRLVLAALGLAAVVMTNWPGSVVLVAAVLAYLLSREPSTWLSRFAPLAGAGLLAYALVCSWIPPSTIRTIQANSQLAGGDYRYGSGHVVLGAVVLAGLGVLWLICAYWNVARGLRCCFFFTYLMASVTLWAEWGHRFLLPQPQRFHLAMEMGLWLSVVLGAAAWLPRSVAKVIFICLLIGACFQLPTYRRYARRLARPVAMAQRIEFRTAQWLAQHRPGERVMVPGSTSFWLNAFTDQPQYIGCCDQGMVNPLSRIAQYVLFSDDGTGTKAAEISRLWLEAFGAQVFVSAGPRSQEIYHAFTHWQKFDGILPVLWREGDDVIYDVPQRSRSLARVIGRADLPDRTPTNGIDVDPLRRYVAGLRNPQYGEANWRWLDLHSADVVADVRPGELISVQLPGVPGWQARSGSQWLAVHADALGQMWIDPGAVGRVTMRVSFDGGRPAKVTRWVSILALLLSLSVVLASAWRSRAARHRRALSVGALQRG